MIGIQMVKDVLRGLGISFALSVVVLLICFCLYCYVNIHLYGKKNGLRLIKDMFAIHQTNVGRRTTGGRKIEHYIERENDNIENGRLPDIVTDYNNTARELARDLAIAPEPPENEAIQEIAFFLNRNPVILNIFNDDAEYNNVVNVLDDIQDIAEAVIRWNRAATGIDNANNNANATKDERITDYYNRNKAMHSDKQNVHDSNVNAELRKTYQTLVTEQDSNTQNDNTMDYIAFYIHQTPDTQINQETKTKAMLTLDYLAEKAGGLTVNNVAVGLKLSELLLLVWNRAYHINNRQNEYNIKDSIISALADCIDPVSGEMVCSGGMSARMLGALTLLDYNKELSQLESSEMLKNEILGEVHKILLATIKEQAVQGDGDMKLYARSFDDMSIADSAIPERTKEEFKKIMALKVDALLMSDSYRGKRIPYDVKQIALSAL